MFSPRIEQGRVASAWDLHCPDRGEALKNLSLEKNKTNNPVTKRKNDLNFFSDCLTGVIQTTQDALPVYFSKRIVNALE